MIDYLFKFFEINDSILEMVQDRDTVASLQWKSNRKLYIAYRMAPLPMPLKVTFAVWNLCNSDTLWNIAQIYLIYLLK